MTSTEPQAQPRTPLSRERVLRAAVAVADRGGIDTVTMRAVAEELGAEAMSLYHHVANKGDILDGVVDVVMEEVARAVGPAGELAAAAEWKPVVRRRILAAREVLLRHPWAPWVFQTRTSMSPAVLEYFDTLLGILRAGGFSYGFAHHSLHALGSRALGFTQELFSPAASGPPDQAATEAAMAGLAGRFPHLAAMLADAVHDDPDHTLGWCDDQAEFEFGLDVLLDGLDRLRSGVTRSATHP